MPDTFRPLRTAEDMYDYCETYDLGLTNSKKSDLKRFELIRSHLSPGEAILTVFIGLHNFKSNTNHEGSCAYAITSKRIVIAQNQILGDFIKSISIDNLNDISFSSGFFRDIIDIDTIKEHFVVSVPHGCGEPIHECIHQALEMAKQSRSSMVSEQSTAHSDADEIVKFKKLLDDGIITSEEFEAKKRQLLGL